MVQSYMIVWNIIQRVIQGVLEVHNNIELKSYKYPTKWCPCKHTKYDAYALIHNITWLQMHTTCLDQAKNEVKHL